MIDRLTKSAARNIFYGGSLFFFLVFVVLVADSVRYATNGQHQGPISEAAARGKRVWEKSACFDCHTLFGEGARFAPELGKVWVKYGGLDDPESAKEGLKAWIKSQPSGAEGRHQMPHFDFTEAQLDDLVEFLRQASTVDTQNWPPKPAK
jgi:nitric oxide reductase subunit C